MPNTSPPGKPSQIPDGYSAIPIHESELEAMVRVCVLAKLAAEPAAGHLVLLRDLPDAMVYLGCLADSGGHLLDWLEIWVQNMDGLESSLPALREAFSNQSLDQRWGALATSFARINPNGFIETGWETRHPPPVILDLNDRKPVHPATGGKRWELCQDEALLQAAGLPRFGSSLFRYLYVRESSESGFIPVVAGGPGNKATRPVAEAVGSVSAGVPFNLQAGLLMAQRHSPVSYEEFANLLGGKPWKGLEHGKRVLTFNGVYANLADNDQMQQSGSHLFLGGQGRSGRLVETFHLKLHLFVEALSSVRQFVAQQQLPFLNLASDSFRVRLQAVGTRLPFLWTAHCNLVKPSQAFALPIESSDLRYFIRARPGGPSAYYPADVNTSSQGSGNVRIRTVLPPDQGRTLLEATLVMREEVKISPHDLLWVRLPLPGRRVDLYGHLYSSDGLAPGEARFRTVPQNLAEEVVQQLRAAEGVSLARAPFEVVPLLSTPCDLYALGVLAARTFLVNPQNTLAVALDELLSLARQVAAEPKPDVPLPSRIASILNQEPRFAKSLAPNLLVQEAMEPAAGFELLPAELWHHTLAAMVCLFPGIGPDSYCKDYGDAPALALEVVFNKPLEEFEQLLIRSRSLVVIDWQANREVHSAIRDVLDRVS